jgi:hypothetical protein
MENVFTSLSLVNNKLEKKTSLAGTMNKVSQELPSSVQNKARAQPWCCGTTVWKNDKTIGHNKEKTRDYYQLQPNKGMSKCVKKVKGTQIVFIIRTRNNS